MEALVTELAKYLILILAVCYTYLSFAVLRKKNAARKRWMVNGQTFLILFLHLFCFLLLFMQQRELKLVWLYIAQLLVLVLSSLFYRKLYRNFSTELFLHMQFFLVTGFVFVTRLSFESGLRQTVFAGAALLVCLLVPFCIRWFSVLGRMAWIYGLAGIALLLWVLVAGKEVYGATNWVKVFGISIQPSEFVKILYVFMLASFLAKRTDLRQVVLVSAFAAVHVLILVAERDLGGALLFYITYVVMLFAATRNYWYLLAGAGGGAVASVAAYFLFSHVRVRVLAWSNPWDYIDQEGYQVAQSLFGIGTGGWFGMGLGKGLPGTIPVVVSDFIFSGMAEEFGGFFAICLILIYVCSFLLFIQLAWKIKKQFHQYIAVGCCTMYFIQVFLSIGGAIKLIPSTGVTLPLISYGGSSLISSLLIFFIVQGLYVVGNAERKGRTPQTLIQKDRADGSQVGTGKGFFSRIDRTMVVTYGFLTLFLGLILYFSYFITFESRQVINNSYNRRQELFAKETLRGDILAADGTVLAYSVEEDGQTQRIYPYEEVYSHFVGRNSNGKTGVEALMNFELLSSHDSEWKKLTEKLKGILNEGDRVVTTVDTTLQLAADAALCGYRGAAIVLEPSTGQILAMVSKPDYDPNVVSNEWEELTEDAKSESRLLNRATNGLYPPGSTFKVLTALEYIRENPDWENEEYECKGSFREGDYRIQCYNNTTHGIIGLERAFALSCNTFFASHGMLLSRTDFRTLAEQLLFNQELPANFPHKASIFSLTEKSKADEVMQTMIGQGRTQITPLHNAMIAATIANGGILMQPYAVDRVETWDGQLVEKCWPKSVGSLLSGKEAEILTKFMEEVIIHGTATKLTGYPYDIYGKTGTAEYVTTEGEVSSHSWFMGFTDWVIGDSDSQEHRKIAISVIVEGEDRGNLTATDVTAKILQAWKP